MKLEDALLLAVIGLTFILGALIYSQIPNATIPAHWNEYGVVDGYAPSWFLLFIPLLTAGIYALFWVIPRITTDKKSWKEFAKYYDQTRIGIILLLVYIFILTLLPLQGVSFNMGYAIFPVIAVLFVYLGHIMPHFKQNYFIGIRTPWALDNKAVWDKTQRRGGKVFMLMGLGVFLAGMFPEYFFPLFMGAVFGGVIYVFAYSYFVWKKVKRKK